MTRSLPPPARTVLPLAVLTKRRSAPGEPVSGRASAEAEPTRAKRIRAKKSVGRRREESMSFASAALGRDWSFQGALSSTRPFWRVGVMLRRSAECAYAPSMARDVYVVGSVNVDLVVTAATLPRPGETVAGGTFERHGGGKSANQAVAAARLGAQVRMVGAVGDDDLGEEALAALRDEGIDVSAVQRLEGCATGVALIV